MTAQLVSLQTLPAVISLLNKCPLITQNKGMALHLTFECHDFQDLSLTERIPLTQWRETSLHFNFSLSTRQEVSDLPDRWQRLSSHFACCQLSLELTLTDCPLTDPKTLVDALKGLPLTKLTLDKTSIEDTGAELLAQAVPQIRLTHLSLKCTGITKWGTNALARVLPQTSINQLDLSWNGIGDGGAEALVWALPQTSITQLDLSWNRIGNGGAETLVRALPQTSITPARS